MGVNRYSSKIWLSLLAFARVVDTFANCEKKSLINEILDANNLVLTYEIGKGIMEIERSV